MSRAPCTLALMTSFLSFGLKLDLWTVSPSFDLRDIWSQSSYTRCILSHGGTDRIFTFDTEPSLCETFVRPHSERVEIGIESPSQRLHQD